MTVKKNAFLLSVVCALVSINAYPAEKPVIKEDTTPPASAEAFAVSAIPPLLATGSNIGPTSPPPITQNASH